MPVPSRRTFPYICILAVLLSGCAQPGTGISPDATPTEVEIILPTPGPTLPTCINIESQPLPESDGSSRFPSVEEGDHIRGAEDAYVTIIIYDDFQCIDCNYLPLSKRLLEKYPNDVRFVYRYYPYTEYYDKADMAARAAEAAAQQNKFWEMHDILFGRQSEWVDLSPAAFERWVYTQVEALGMDRVRFKEDFISPRVIERVKNSEREGAELGIPVLPFLLLNGEIYTGSTNFEILDQVISLIMLGKRQYNHCPPFIIDPKLQYSATLQTEKGNIEIQLFPDKAPLAVNSFVYLARGGWYDDITFHRVLPGFVAQTGDPSETGEGNPGYLFKTELDPSLKFDQPGMLGMANSGPDTNGSQFFITYEAAPHLNGRYTIFGRVIRGLDVLDRLTPRDPQTGESLPPGDKLIQVIIKEK